MSVLGGRKTVYPAALMSHAAQTSFFADERQAEAETSVSVLVPLPVDRAYSYAVPEGQVLAAGTYVGVSVGKREIIGVVWDDASDASGKALKPVQTIYDLPPLPSAHRAFVDWMAGYTMTERGAVLKMTLSVPAAFVGEKGVVGYRLKALPPSFILPPQSGGRNLAVKPPPAKRGEAGRGVVENAKALRSDMTKEEKLLWFHLSRKKADGFKFRRQHPIPPYIADFCCLEKRLVVELDGSQHVEEQADYDRERTAYLEQYGFQVLRFWNREVMENAEGVVATIIDVLSKRPTTPLPTSPLYAGGGDIAVFMMDKEIRRASEIIESTGCTAAKIKKLVKEGILETVEIKPLAPCSHPDPHRTGADLSDPQNKAAQAICAAIEVQKYKAFLLDGVTGAGKTETYFEGVAAALKADKQVLILLPEIALTNAFLDRFKERFGCAPALWHSDLTPAQRRVTWRGVAEGKTEVIVGARSALFLPFADLGFIVVDEEHDPAYKQEEGVIYHARDMAVARAHHGKIPVVLASATPSLETMANVWAGRYEALKLPDRHGGAKLPDVHIIDLRENKPERGNFIAPKLIEAVRQNLEANEQSLLFLNRRGYAPLTLCRACGHRMDCPRCSAWLVEHRRTNKLHCHHCGYNLPTPKSCPTCHEADSFAACGPGVERIMEEVKELFPQARTEILASDTVEDGAGLRDMLDRIRSHQIDIIVGTQIIAKGHHFPNLTLVGVIDADLGLGGGELRAAERTYQLLHQVSGRAGREEKMGHVYLQTYMPENRVMKALAACDRDAFLEVEAAEREEAGMPPFSRLAGIIVSGRNEKQVEDAAKDLGRVAPMGEKIQVFGPAEAPFYRLRGNFRRRLLVRADKTVNLQKAVHDWLTQVKIPSTVRVQVDVDPQGFL